VGTRVEAAFEGTDSYFPGVIADVNEDYTYAIDYDDGDKESVVEPELVVPLVTSLNQEGNLQFASTPHANSPHSPHAIPPPSAEQAVLTRVLYNQQQQLSQQVYLSQQLAHSIRLQEKILASVEPSSPGIVLQGSTHLRARPDGGFSLVFEEGAPPHRPEPPPRLDVAANAAAGNRRARRRHGQAHRHDRRDRPDRHDRHDRRARRRFRGRNGLLNCRGWWKVFVAFFVIGIVFFEESALDYLDLVATGGAGFQKYDNMQLWLQSVPANDPMHLCYGMSMKNLNSYPVDIKIFHISNLHSPVHELSLAPNEVLKMPSFTRRTAYEVSRPTMSGNRLQRGKSSTQSHKMFSFVYDAQVHGESAVLRLKNTEASFSRCDEYANGQFRPAKRVTTLQSFDDLQELIDNGL